MGRKHCGDAEHARKTVHRFSAALRRARGSGPLWDRPRSRTHMAVAHGKPEIRPARDDVRRPGAATDLRAARTLGFGDGRHV